MPLAPGTRPGPYEIVSPLGEGGMGDVYKARDTRLDRTVAIKVSTENFSDRFEREARAIAALNHPHICQLYDVGPNYLVMEYVEGAPLVGPLPPEEALRFAGEINTLAGDPTPTPITVVLNWQSGRQPLSAHRAPYRETFADDVGVGTSRITRPPSRSVRT